MIFGTFVTITISALGFIGIVTAAWVLSRSAALKASIEAMKASSDSWKGEAEAQKARADRLDANLAQLTARVEAIEVENRSLRDLASGASAVAALTALVSMQHNELLFTLGTLAPAPARPTPVPARHREPPRASAH